MPVRKIKIETSFSPLMNTLLIKYWWRKFVIDSDLFNFLKLFVCIYYISICCIYIQ